MGVHTSSSALVHTTLQSVSQYAILVCVCVCVCVHACVRACMCMHSYTSHGFIRREVTCCFVVVVATG